MEDIGQKFGRRRMPWQAVLGVAFIVTVTLGGVASLVYGNVRALTETTPPPHSSAIASSTASEMSNASQVSDAGSVKVVVQWLGPAGPIRAGQIGEIAEAASAAVEGTFAVTFDTHSADLDIYDIGQAAVLHTSAGEKLLPVRWDFPKGGHHRKGIVAFPAKDNGGKALFAAPVEQVELVIHDVGGVRERTFRWTR